VYIKLIDRHKFESSVLHIHGDIDEFLEEIQKWKTELLAWAADLKYDGMPLMRLEADVCMVDLLRHLIAYYIKTSPYCKGRVVGTFRLVGPPVDLTNETVMEIKTYE